MISTTDTTEITIVWTLPNSAHPDGFACAAERFDQLLSDHLVQFEAEYGVKLESVAGLVGHVDDSRKYISSCSVQFVGPINEAVAGRLLVWVSQVMNLAKIPAVFRSFYMVSL